jgi:hypothetical protein
MIGRSLNIYRIEFVVIALMLVFLCVLPSIAQPTSLRDFKAPGRQRMTQERLKELEQINVQIENDKSNVSLYKKRLQIYGDLGELNYDVPNFWDNYRDKYEADLSKIIALEKTAGNYYQRGAYITEKLRRLSVKNVSDIYPHNSYVDAATSDFLKALRLTPDPQEIQNYYTNLSVIYSTRPKLLVSAPDFPKWKDKIPLKLVQKDFELSIKYSRLALEAGASLPFIDTLKKNLAATYLTNAETATKLGDSATSLKFTQAAEKYRE